MVESNVWKLSNILTPSITEKFEIPRYQRGYAWESKQVEEFCEDLWETNEDTKKIHPFGTIYCEEDRENNTVIIVDGQQRITTSMIFLCVARDWADELLPESKEADNMNDSLFRFDAALRKVDEDSPRLKLGRANKDYFRRRILPRKVFERKSADIDRTDNDSCDNIQKAYVRMRVFIESKLRKIPDAPDNTENPNPPIPVKDRIVKLNHVWNTLSQNFTLITVTVPDEKEAYKTFHTMNNRGLKLAEADLIKHHLFSQMHKELSKNPAVNLKDKLDDYDILWTELRDNITSDSDADYEMSVFIHHYLVVHKNKESNAKKIYEEKGFLLAKIDYQLNSTENKSENLVNVIFEIKENNNIQVNSVLFVGNKKISSSTLKNFLEYIQEQVDGLVEEDEDEDEDEFEEDDFGEDLDEDGPSRFEILGSLFDE